LLSEVLAAAGLPDDGWEFGRTGGHRSSYRSAERGIFVKLTRPEGLQEMALESRFATWAASVGLSTVRLIPELTAQPVVTASGAATFWELHEAVPRPQVDAQWMGQALAEIHQHSGGIDLAPWSPESWFRPELAALRARPDVDSALLDRLQEQGERILARSASLLRGKRLPIVHGDPHAGNVVRTARGAQLFCDFELAQVGPAEWDLGLVSVQARRLGLPEDRASQMLDAYGSYDPELLDAMMELRELRMTSHQRYRDRPDFVDQLRARVESLGDGGIGKWATSFRAVEWHR
jgi:Ser/Thr protein kinase RdoA (MazF antagonist)